MKNNIFLIDDDKNILTSVSMLLEAEGFKVRTFSDGESGLKAILESNPDVAVVDIKMPRLDGIELLKKLRRTSNMPVIFLTSKDTEIDELLFEMHESEINYLSMDIKKIMENASLPEIKLDIPLIADIGKGDSWTEAH